MKRKGLGKGQGKGYYNMLPMDSHIHSLSAKGMSLKKFHSYDPKAPTYGDWKQDDYLDAKSNRPEEIPSRGKILEKYYKEYEDRWSYDPRMKHGLENWMGGTRHFRLVPLETVKLLVDKEFLEPDMRQNDSPTTQQFMDFMKKWKKYDVTAHGYAVSKQREDKRVTIEGLEVHDKKALKDLEFVEDWYAFNRFADELDKERSWWD